MIRSVAGQAATEVDVRVQPGASRSGVVGVVDDRLRVRLSSPPVDGRANDELIAVLAEALGLRPREIGIVRGLTGRSKTVRVARTEAEVRTLLVPWMGQNQG
ncbi:MAG: hypothetical protein RJB65_2306 [Actinomycetota bacterium]